MNKIYEPKPNTWSAILERTKTVDDIELTVKEILKKFRKEMRPVPNILRF
jgi:histidinol dehydrogenase